MTSRILAALVSILAASPAALLAAPADRELIEAVQRQVKTVISRTDPAIACVVVSRSSLYPNPPSADSPGKLGDFNRIGFLQASTRADKHEVARRLDLADRGST